MAAVLPNGVGTSKVVDRRRSTRFEGMLDATFMVSDAGGVRVEPCQIASLSDSGMRISTGEEVRLGQAIWVDIAGFGPVRGNVEAVRHDGFVCHNLINDPARRRLATWVAWLARTQGRWQGDKRAFMRSRPHDRRTTVAFEDGDMIAVELKDVSRSGVAVLTDYAAAVGMAVMVGRVLGRVTRLFADGFGVEFETPIEGRDADSLICGFQIKAVPLASVG
jgi:hypothetical protein